MPTRNEIEMYIRGVVYQGSTWTSFSEDIFELVDAKLSEINGLEWWEFSVNKTENWILSSESSREELLLIFKNIKYNSNDLFEEADVNFIRTTIINKLYELSDDLTFTDVEFRTNKIWY